MDVMYGILPFNSYPANIFCLGNGICLINLTNLIMEANTINPDQTAHKEAV